MVVQDKNCQSDILLFKAVELSAIYILSASSVNKDIVLFFLLVFLTVSIGSLCY